MALGKPAVVADGDKGDITVSSSGDTWTIDNSVVDTSNLGGDITTAGKALLDDADAAAQRTTLGLGTMATANSADYLPRAGGTMTGTLTVNDTNLTLRDNTDTTKQAQFELSGITTATTRTYTLPNLTGTLATTGSISQTFTGTTTFSGATVSVGVNTGTSTVNVGTGATTGASTKTINIGNGHAGTGTTDINILTSTSGTGNVISVGSNNNFGVTMANIGSGVAINSPWIRTLSADSSSSINQYNGFIDFTQITYDSKSKSISAQDTDPTGMFFKPDGTSVFILGDANDRVYRYDLSTAWDISTAGAVVSTSPSLAAQSATLSGLTFSPDGTNMYIGSELTDLIYQYTLSTPWDLFTVTYANKSCSLTSTSSKISGIFFAEDGATFIYASGPNVFHISLSGVYDISTSIADRRNKGSIYAWGSGTGGSYLCPKTGMFFYADIDSTAIAVRKIYPNKTFRASLRHLGDYDGYTFGYFNSQSENSLKAIWYEHGKKKFYTLGTTNKTIYQHSVGWDSSTSWDTIYSTKSLGLSQQYGYTHFEGGVWYNNVRLDQRLAPAGGTTSQVLRKASNTNWDYSWSSLSTSDISGLGTIATASSSDYVSSTGGTVTGNLTVTGEITAAGGGFEDALYIDLQQNYGGF